MKEKLPDFLYPLFWDINPERLAIEQHPKYVIERILELGDRPAVKWLEKKYPREKITETIKHSRKISRKTANYFAHLYNVERGQILCLNKPYPKTLKKS